MVSRAGKQAFWISALSHVEVGEMATIAATLASYLEGLAFADLPPEVTNRAKQSVLDTVGVALAGSQTEESKSVVSAVGKIDGGTGATVWGHGTRAAIPMAALINGTSAHARELDDWGGGLHPGAVVVTTAVAAAELSKVSGKDLLTAIVAGYEVMMRVSKAAGGDAQYERGWHPTGSCGTFGAAAATSKIIHLGLDQTTWALGLAGSFTGGTLAFLVDGAMSKRLHPGKAAETGLIAAFLAGEGFTGPTHIFEAECGGFLTTYAPGASNSAQLVDGLGEEFKIMHSGLKPYASCRDVHAAIDAILELRERHHLDAPQVSEVLVESTREAQALCERRKVSTILDAQMSIPYGVAVTLLTGEADLRQYSPERVKDSNVADLASRVKVVASPKFEGAEHCAEVTVQLFSGEQYKHRIDVPKGDPRKPMSEEEVKKKFEKLASPILSRHEIDHIVELIQSLEQIDDTRDLCSLLAGKARSEKNA